MSGSISKPERVTQNRVVKLFHEQLAYTCLGNLEDKADNSGYKLDKYLSKICNKQRFIELLYDFVLFDGGVKKLPRVQSVFWY